MNALITGATGMVGGIVLQHCLKSDKITGVTSISRKTSRINHPKLKEVLHADFSNFDGLESHFKNIDVAYFCLGAYTGAVSDDIFKKITVDFTIAFADQLKKYSPTSKFSFLSGSGADPKEKSRISFARYKGMAENYLIRQGFSSLSIFRPAYIYPVEARHEPNMMYRISRFLYPLIKLFGKNASIRSTDLGKALFQAGLSPPDESILENRAILDYANLFRPKP